MTHKRKDRGTLCVGGIMRGTIAASKAFAMALSLLFATNSSIAAFGQSDVEKLTTVSLGNIPLFQIIAGANGFSAVARTQTMQQNLDQALSEATASGKVPVVDVAEVAGGYRLMINGRCIGEADSGTARALGVTPEVLARRWAEQVKTALASPSMHFASFPEGLSLPVALAVPLTPEMLAKGTRIDARTSRDISLPDGDILKAGAMLSGEIAAIDSRDNTSLIRIEFNTMTLSDGKQFPVAARMQPASVAELNGDAALNVRLGARAQVAVNGAVL
jgi:hypothetical protein